jgi:hypothetical protein
MKSFILVAHFLTLVGCATQYTVYVDSIVNPESSLNQTTFEIFPGNSKIVQIDLVYNEFLEYTKNALSIAGLKHSSINPEMAILLDYGISGPQSNLETRIIPVWGQGTTTQVNNLYGQKVGTLQSGPGVQNNVSSTNSYTTFTRFIKLTAFDSKQIKSKKENSAPKAIWVTKVTSTGASDDLRAVFPIMLGPTIDYFGANTKGNVRVDVNPSDSTIKRLINFKK